MVSQISERLVESVQRRATRLIPSLKHLPYEERLQKINLSSLHYRPARGDMIKVYKYVHGNYNVGVNLLNLAEDSVTRGHPYKLKTVNCQTSVRKAFLIIAWLIYGTPCLRVWLLPQH